MKNMIKNLFSVTTVISVLFVSTLSFAATKKVAFTREYGTAGCGLGSLVVGKQGGQIFAATTNATVWNQTFGITFGTSNCIDSATDQAAKRMDSFVSINRIALADDIAKGNGETLKSVSAILNCSQSSHFNSALQGSFSRIFPSSDVGTTAITDSIINVIKNDAELSGSCKIAG